MRDPRQQRSEDSASRMIDATLKIAGKDGLRAVTVARVAAKARTSNGALYHRFGNRDGLLTATQHRFLSKVEAEVTQMLADASKVPDNILALRMVVGAILDIFDRHEALVRAFMIEGKGEVALERRGYAASALLGNAVSQWLIARFGCSSHIADTIFRLLFAFGATRLILSNEYSLTSYSRSDGEIRKDLLDIVLKVMHKSV